MNLWKSFVHAQIGIVADAPKEKNRNIRMYMVCADELVERGDLRKMTLMKRAFIMSVW